MYHAPLAFKYMYGRSDEGGDNLNGEEGSEISGERERMVIA